MVTDNLNRRSAIPRTPTNVDNKNQNGDVIMRKERERDATIVEDDRVTAILLTCK